MRARHLYIEFNEILSTGHSGDILYHNGIDWVKLNKGVDEQVLTLTVCLGRRDWWWHCW